MRMKTMKMDVHGFWNLIRQSARILIILACFASAQAGTLQEAVIKDGCSKYQDQKSIEPLKKFVEPAMKEGCVACHLDCDKLSQPTEGTAGILPEKARTRIMPGMPHSSARIFRRHMTISRLENPNVPDVEPHSSDIPKLLLNFHGPYAATHVFGAPAPGRKVGLTAANVDSLCYNCHSNFKAEMAAAGSRHKLLSESDRSCMECHDPHAANQEYDLKMPAQELCVSCHDEPQEQVAKGDTPPLMSGGTDLQYLKLSSKYVHEPAKKSCLICHDAHASQFPKELRVSMRDLCMDCHGLNSEKIVQSSQPFPLFNGLVSLPRRRLTS
jgi:predicted CXXCH cytochrome family protein